MQYVTIRRIAVLGLAASLVLALGTQMVALGTTLAAVVAVFLTRVMYQHRADIVKLHQKREAEFGVPRPNDAMIWRTKPRLSDMAPALVFFGLCLLVIAYIEAQRFEPPRRGIMRLIHELFGPIGFVAICCYLGIATLVYGLEILISHRLQQRSKV